MEYPIDNQTFTDLVDLRHEMVQKNPSPALVGIASPFVPWIGSDILAGTPGIYFVGIATRGECEGDSFDRECCLKLSEDIVNNPHPHSLFWRYITDVSKRVFGQEFAKCVSKIGFSNQFKIGVFDRSNENRSLNPEGFYESTQVELCTSILDRELQLASSCAIVFLGDGPVIYPIVGSGGWDTEKYRNPDIDIKYRKNGAPIIFQYHLGSWRFAKHQTENFQAHAEVVEFEIQRYLGHLRK